MYRKINKDKVNKALKCSEEWVNQAKEKGVENTGSNVMFCEERNISVYRDILSKDYILEMDSFEKELYRAI